MHTQRNRTCGPQPRCTLSRILGAHAGALVSSSPTLLSQHSIDRLIRELISTNRAVVAADGRRILEHVASSPFDPRERPVPAVLHEAFRGDAAADQAASLLIHLQQRILLDQQWSPATSPREYLQDLRTAIRRHDARLLVYRRRGGHVAGVFAPTHVPLSRRGQNTLPWTYVVYSADRGMLVTGYQVSGIEEVRLPEHVRWLK